MKRPAGRSVSLLPCEPAQDPAYQWICNSAPSRVIPDQDEDWNWGSLEPPNESTVSLASTEEAWAERLAEDDQEADVGDIQVAAPEDTRVEIKVAVSDQPAERAGDFTDFIDPTSPDSTDSSVLYSDSDEPSEYWAKAWSYSRSPLSNCSSLSYEDSDDEEDATDRSRVPPTKVRSDDEIKRLPQLNPSPKPSPKLTRVSDVGPGMMRGLTTMIHGTTSFNGPTSI